MASFAQRYLIRTAFRRLLFFQLIINGAFLGLESLIPNHWLFRELRDLGYDWAIDALPHETHVVEDTPPPLAIVDISRMARTRIDGDVLLPNENGFLDSSSFTSRPGLTQLVRTLVETYDVIAIGVDVDFSPDFRIAGGRPPGGQQTFYDTVADLHERHRVPVLLGVGRGSAATTVTGWLGADHMAPYAASLLLAAESKVGDRAIYSRVPLFLAPYPVQANEPVLPSLAFALTKAYTGQQLSTTFPITETTSQGPNELLAPLFREIELEANDGTQLKGEAFYINYRQSSQLRQLVLDAEHVLVDSQQPKPFLMEQLRGKMVLIGNADMISTGDKVVMPGHRNPIPGIFAHACAVLSLLYAPVARLDIWAELIIGLALAIAVFGLIKAMERALKRFTRLSISANAGEMVSLVTALLATLTTATLLGRFENIMWMGAFSTALGSLIESGFNLVVPVPRHPAVNPSDNPAPATETAFPAAVTPIE